MRIGILMSRSNTRMGSMPPDSRVWCHVCRQLIPIFDSSGINPSGTSTPSPLNTPTHPPTPGPIVVKTLVALQYAVNLNASDYQDEAVQLALAEDAVVTIRHAGLNQAIVAFQVRVGWLHGH